MLSFLAHGRSYPRGKVGQLSLDTEALRAGDVRRTRMSANVVQLQHVDALEMPNGKAFSRRLILQIFWTVLGCRI